MMKQKGRGNATIRAAKNVITSPAVWIGILAGTASGFSLAGKSPLGGMIGFGAMVGVGVALLAYVVGVFVSYGYRTNHKNAVKNDPREWGALLTELKDSGHDEVSTLLKKMVADRSAILTKSEEYSDEEPLRQSAEMVGAIVSKSFHLAEEWQDLVRRSDDPLLESPENAADRIPTIRSILVRAYQAVADARSNLRLKTSSPDIDFLQSETNFDSRTLPALLDTLEEKTSVEKNVADRLHPEYKSGIVFEEPPESVSDEELESH